jgi:hypothetical protein
MRKVREPSKHLPAGVVEGLNAFFLMWEPSTKFLNKVLVLPPHPHIEALAKEILNRNDAIQ